MMMGIRKIIFIELLYAILIFSMEEIDENPRNRVQLMYNKQLMPNNDAKFRSVMWQGDITDFERFLGNTEVFIDKSLFIHNIHKYYLGLENPIVVTAPSRWGKSTIIAMLKFFYMIELNVEFDRVDITTTNAYKFFHNGEITYNGKTYLFDSPPLLSDNKYKELREKYLGKQPIFAISFASLFTAGDNVRNNLRDILNIALVEFGYGKVIDHFCTTQKNIDKKSKVSKANMLCEPYYSYFKEKIHTPFIIKIIVKILRKYFENWVVLIIDEMEQFPMRVYESPKLNEIEQYEYLQFYIEILQPVTKGNSDILYTLIVGIFPFHFPGTSTIRPTFKRYFEKDMLPFFGLLDNLANDLFKRAAFKPEKVKEMNNSYNHYRSPDYIDISHYNPFSVLTNLHTPEKNPWATANRQIPFIKKIVENDINARNYLFLLLQGECLEIEYNVNKQHMPDISTFIGVDPRVPSKDERFYIDFKHHLWHVGFVTISDTKKYYDVKENAYFRICVKHLKRSIPRTTYCLSIPNNETRDVFELLLHFPQTLQRDAIRLFNEMMNNNSIPASQFGEIFQSILNFVPKTVMHGSEMYYHSFLFHQIIEKFGRFYNYNYMELDHSMIEGQFEHPDIVIHNNHKGVVIEVKFNISEKKFDEYFDLQLSSYGLAFHKANKDVPILRLICLLVRENKDRTISVKVKEYIPLKSEEDFNELKTIYEKNKLKHQSKPKRSSRNPDCTKVRKNTRTTFTMQPPPDTRKLTTRMTETTGSPTMPTIEGKSVEPKNTSLPNA